MKGKNEPSDESPPERERPAKAHPADQDES
jgi:hypothetical protein